MICCLIKKRLSVVIFLYFVCSSLYVFAQTRPEYHYFTVSDNIAKPVTVKTQSGSFKIYNSYTYRGHISRLEAFDAHGRRIVNTQPQKKSIPRSTDYSKPMEYWYVFDMIYEDYDTQSESDNIPRSNKTEPQVYARDQQSEQQYDYNPYWDQLFSGNSNLQVRLGTGLLGEILELRGELGEYAFGFTAFAGVQKDLLFFKNDNESFIDGLNAGLGCYFGGLKNTFTLNLQYGDNWRSGQYIVVGFQYSHFFNRRLGLFIDTCAGGHGAGFKQFMVSAQGGIAFKILTK